MQSSDKEGLIYPLFSISYSSSVESTHSVTSRVSRDTWGWIWLNSHQFIAFGNLFSKECGQFVQSCNKTRRNTRNTCYVYFNSNHSIPLSYILARPNISCILCFPASLFYKKMGKSQELRFKQPFPWSFSKRQRHRLNTTSSHSSPPRCEKKILGWVGCAGVDGNVLSDVSGTINVYTLQGIPFQRGGCSRTELTSHNSIVVSSAVSHKLHSVYSCQGTGLQFQCLF